jgi:hypothetical protein
MTYREKVLSVYPTALVVEDTHLYLNGDGSSNRGLNKKPFAVFMCNNGNKERYIKADYQKNCFLFSKIPRNNNTFYIKWCSSEEEAWQETWEEIQVNIVEKLAL